MSLVLNTNRSWNWWYTIANESIIPPYPNPNDNILLSFDWQINLSALTEPSSSAFSVNWTKVHQIARPLLLPTDREIKWNQWYYQPPTLNIISSCLNGSDKTSFIRIWLEKPFEAWMTIWKTIIFPNATFITSSSWEQFVWLGYLKSATYKVWILHSDGTITYIATRTISNTDTQWEYISNYWGPDWNSSAWRPWRDVWTEEIQTTNWYTTIDWDYLIVEISFVNHWTSSRPDNWLAFWSYAPTKALQRLKIFQVSIE